MTETIGAPGGSAPGALAPPVALGDGISLLANGIELDGRVGWFPKSVRGFAPINAYLLTDGDDALLIDTGVTVHLDSVVSQVRASLPGDRMSIAVTRIGEYAAICNTSAIAEQIPVDAVYAVVPGAMDWVEFRTREARADHGWALGRPPESRVFPRDVGLQLGSHGRRLHAFFNPVRLLPSLWFYDDGTRTLFTGDAFSHAWSARSDGPWVVDESTRGVDVASVRDHLFTRCWWIPEAHQREELQAGLAEVFDTYDVESIAPGYGCVIRGREEVQRHYSMVYDAIGDGKRAELSQ